MAQNSRSKNIYWLACLTVIWTTLSQILFQRSHILGNNSKQILSLLMYIFICLKAASYFYNLLSYLTFYSIPAHICISNNICKCAILQECFWFGFYITEKNLNYLASWHPPKILSIQEGMRKSMWSRALQEWSKYLLNWCFLMWKAPGTDKSERFGENYL